MDGPEADVGQATPAPRRPRLRQVLLALAVLVSLLSVGATAGVLYLQHRLVGQIARIDGAFDGLEDRPVRPTSGPGAQAVNVLVAVTGRQPSGGTDRAAGSGAWTPGTRPTEALMLVHFDGDRREASVIALPRDSWVPVPGHGTQTIDTAFSSARPALAVQTVEHLTGVRVDHLAVIGWEGFGQLADAVGGVTVDVARTVVDPERGVTWAAGEHVLDARTALAYVGQRSGLPGGDLDQVRRQQNFLRLLMEDSLHAEMRKSPRMLFDFLDVVTRNLAVDDDWSTSDLAALAVSLRSLRTADIRYLAVPVRGRGHEGARSVVYLDAGRGARLWRMVREDRIGPWVDRHPGVQVPRLVD